MSESDLERDFVKECEHRGWLAVKLNLKGYRGWPDRMIIGPLGQVRFVELKVPFGRLSPSQEVVHDLLWQRNIKVHIPTRGEDFERIFE